MNAYVAAQSAQSAQSAYHVLLIGIDEYQEPANELQGCVNDVMAVEQFLQQVTTEGLIDDELRITRLVAPNDADLVPGEPLLPQDLPDRKNIVRELRRLAGDEVQQGDKILIYYSGHGYQWQPEWSRVQHEALVTQDAKVLYDVELNALLNNIAARTTDLTIVLDCCHSEGTFRDLDLSNKPQAEVQDRVMTLRAGSALPKAEAEREFPRPDEDIVGPAQLATTAATATTSRPGAHMLESMDPNYIMLLACRAEEKAREGKISGGPFYGVFTRGLMNVLREVRSSEPGLIKSLRWADIWSVLLYNVSSIGRELGNVQHPFMVGRPERKVFGGTWTKQDAGIPIRMNEDGQTYTISAGTLSGVTEGAKIAIYGRDLPQFFAEATVGSEKEMEWRWGTLRVIEADRAASMCVLEGAKRTGELPMGSRARLIAAGNSGKLRVRLTNRDSALELELAKSDLIELLPPEEKDWEIEVVAQPDGGWSLNDLLTKDLARVPAGRRDALKAGLETYYRYAIALRLAQNCKDQQLNGSFSARLLDASDSTKLVQIDPNDPQLDEVTAENGTYYLKSGDVFCLRLQNSSSQHVLHFYVLNCTGSGKVEYLGNETANPGDTKVIWQGANIKPPLPFLASTADPLRDQIDRIIVIATTRQDADLRWLEMEQKVQEVVDVFSSRELITLKLTKPVAGKPPELWSAKIIPWHIKATGSL